MKITEEYTIKQYKEDISTFGLDNVWDSILEYVETNNCSQNPYLSIENFGDMYEVGLSHVNKNDKKEKGKYFTPKDVSNLMSSWLVDLKGENICDVCCGVGNLILSYLNTLSQNDAEAVLKNGNVYLYDIDSTALKICLETIKIIYGEEAANGVNVVNEDFLDKNIHLPKHCKVISNPPYGSIKTFSSNWNITPSLKNTKELYISIMEKILNESESSVIITPYSFLNNQNAYSFRKNLNNFNGFIVSFDHVPGSIFGGKKKGLFGENEMMSVRASITVTENIPNRNGYKISPLIRFNNSEKSELLNKTVLEKTIPDTYQIISENNKLYSKCFKEMENVFNTWHEKSETSLKSIISESKTDYPLCTLSSCRYFMVASVKDLNRNGKYTLYFNDELTRNIMYCFINSSFSYWHWRLYDGGILYKKNLLLSLPIFLNAITKENKDILNNIAKEMQNIETKFLVYKMNAGKSQESIKFPEEYRNKLNKIFLEILGEQNPKILDKIHKNVFFEKR